MSILGAGPSKLYIPEWRHVEPHKQRYIRKYATTRHTYTVQCTHEDEVTPTLENVDGLFTSLIKELTANVDPSHYIGLSIQSPSLDYPITLPYTRLQSFKTENLFHAIQRTLNSNEDFAIDGRLRIELTHVEIPQGRGPNKPEGKLLTILQYIHMRLLQHILCSYKIGILLVLIHFLCLQISMLYFFT